MRRKPKNEETFLIRINDCQNSTWQGSILWAEKKKTQHFRSTLELISLIEAAVQLDRDNVALEGGFYEK